MAGRGGVQVRVNSSGQHLRPCRKQRTTAIRTCRVTPSGTPPHRRLHTAGEQHRRTVVPAPPPVASREPKRAPGPRATPDNPLACFSALRRRRSSTPERGRKAGGVGMYLSLQQG
eukprot:gene20377-biopygen19109